AMGARPETFTGLSGLGDLVVTCTSRHSRNRKFGELLAKGYTPDDAEEEIGMVVEGRTTVRAVPDLIEKVQQELPISEEVYSIAWENGDPKEAVERLMLRELKPESLPGDAAF
ncbi:MAG: NAD(P)H-dependent glycerol-3-phosphate dehydrogenase, partial [Candidatus Hinthialibacter sp.]